MNLHNKDIDDLFDRFSTVFGGSKIITQSGFKKVMHSILDESKMLKYDDHISLPNLRNKLENIAYISSLIEMHKSGDLSDKEFIRRMHEVSEEFRKNIDTLTKGNQD